MRKGLDHCPGVGLRPINLRPSCGTGQCPVCRNYYKLTMDGNLRLHAEKLAVAPATVVAA